MDHPFGIPSFHNLDLLQQAMTHRSYVNENASGGGQNERLEFLGDAILNFLSGEFLFKRYPDKPEGELTPLRSALVDEKQLAEFARWLDLGTGLRLGKGAEKEGGRHNANLLSSAFEAVVGAYFLDAHSEIEPVRQFVEPLFAAVVEHLAVSAPQINYKSRLQQWALAEQGENPQYVLINQSGPDHAKQFTVIVQVTGQQYGEGMGKRIQDAEKMAAKAALEKLKLI
ncbi:MAG: ribonuclease III [Elainella sp. Prado103]|nr:ribonuclease III [Elainella sp. Prado103]